MHTLDGHGSVPGEAVSNCGVEFRGRGADARRLSNRLEGDMLEMTVDWLSPVLGAQVEEVLESVAHVLYVIFMALDGQ